MQNDVSRLPLLRRIAKLAAPLLIGQLAVVAYGVADTVMTARYGANDLAALALGVSIYISIFLGLSGILQALIPLLAHSYGGQRMQEIGQQMRQGVWLALLLSAIGSSLLLHPQVLLDLAKASPELQDKARQYLQTLAFALPAALGFVLFSALNNAIARPRMVMALQLLGLGLKIALNACFIYGELGMPELGGPGCALASACVYWLNITLGLIWLKRSRPHQQFELFGHGLGRPSWAEQRKLLRLGLPLGLAFFIEVTSFAFMAIFIARLGETALAAHQIVANIGTVMYMLPLAIASATSTLVAQALGAAAREQAARIAWSGLQLAIGAALFMGSVIWLLKQQVLGLYTSDSRVIEIALPLFSLLAFYQVFDAAQSVLGYILRAYHIVVVPMIFNAFALWGVGLLGGCILGLDLLALQPPAAIAGVRGFWLSNSLSLVVLAAALLLFVRKVQQRSLANKNIK